jgi:putative oxidoreductase
MGAGIAYHGFGKIFEPGQMAKFTQGVAKLGFSMPEAFAWMAALSEFLGGILIVLGFRTRIAAFFVFVTMSVAIFLQHAGDPLSKKELAMAYWTMAGALVLTGSGKYSIDGAPKKAS